MIKKKKFRSGWLYRELPSLLLGVAKDDFMRVMYSFYNDSFVNKSMNASFSTSIPKKLGASNIKDYEPIILIGSAYKSIGKVLAY